VQPTVENLERVAAAAGAVTITQALERERGDE